MKKETILLTVLAMGGLLLFAAIVGLVLLLLTLPTKTTRKLDIGLGSRVAVVDLEGVIWDAKPIVDLITEYTDNSRVKAIVVNINSPGGGVAPSQEIYESLLKARKEKGKPVVACMGAVAASGAYYVACAANEIVAAPGGITGSVGVYMRFSNWEGLYDKIGIGFKTIKRGKFKTAGAEDRPMTPEEEAMLQSMVDDIYEQFLEAVIDGRYDAVRALHMDDDEPPAQAAGADVSSATVDVAGATRPSPSTTDFDVHARIRELAEGRIYTGRQAKELGLADTLGYLDKAIERAAARAGIVGEPIVLRRSKRQESGFDFLSQLGTEVKAAAEGTRPFIAYLLPFASGM